VATGILVFDFELFIDGRSNCHEYQLISSGHMRWSDLALTSAPGLFSSLESLFPWWYTHFCMLKSNFLSFDITTIRGLRSRRRTSSFPWAQDLTFLFLAQTRIFDETGRMKEWHRLWLRKISSNGNTRFRTDEIYESLIELVEVGGLAKAFLHNRLGNRQAI